MFYEAVGCIVSAEVNAARRDEVIVELFKLPNSRWLEIIGQAMQDPSQLQNQDTMRSIAKILQINVRVASSLGHPYIIQLAAIYERMLQVRGKVGGVEGGARAGEQCVSNREDCAVAGPGPRMQQPSACACMSERATTPSPAHARVRELCHPLLEGSAARGQRMHERMEP